MTDDPLIGQRLANFRIERLIGRGGMAQVYYGQDIALRRPVAIKVIDARYRENVSYAERFVREAQTVATWRHENILQVFYADEQDGLYYFVMEYIDGLDLGQLLSQYAADGELIPHTDVLRIGWAVARALDYAHERGVVHRDVKPSNVMVASDERVVLADFGLAMDVHQGTMGEVFGTPHYIAPEQARRSADAVPQSDLYALGVVLYEMLTGTVPFDDPSPASLALQHLTLPPPPPREINPDLSVETERVLLKSLGKSPQDRYQTGAELMGAIQTSLQARSQTGVDRMELPPPPAGVAMPSLSQRSVADRVVRYVGATSTPTAYPEPLVVATKKHPSRTESAAAALIPADYRRRGRGVMVGLVMIVLVVIGASVLYSVVGNKEDKRSPSSTPQPPTLSEVGAQMADTTASLPPLPTVSPTAIFSATLSLTPTSAPSATSTQAPSLTPTQAATFTVVPTTTPTSVPPLTPTDLPTLTPSFTATVLAALPAEPTILYPGGRHFTLYYDANSLYLHNLSGDKVELQPFAFERLDLSGTPSNRFDGWRWAQFYPYVTNQSCARLLMADAPSYLNPPQCRGYNSEVWPERGMSLDFWTPREGSVQFRVLWNDQEIARCEIAAGTCEVFVP